MMTPGTSASGRPAAHRLAVWLMPPHRKEWGEAMLNEVAHIKSRTAALRWVLGCVLTAFNERVAFELGRTFMTRRIFKVVLALGAVLVIGAIGTYIDAEPYQRERIWIAVHDAIDPGETKRLARNKDAPAP